MALEARILCTHDANLLCVWYYHERDFIFCWGNRAKVHTFGSALFAQLRSKESILTGNIKYYRNKICPLIFNFHSCCFCILRIVYFIQKLFISMACSRYVFRSSPFHCLLICQILHLRDRMYSVFLSTSETCLRVYSLSAEIILEFVLCCTSTACIRMYILIFMLLNDDFLIALLI
jgi:hypothetical protein